MDLLPPELLLQIFSHLDLTSLCRAAQVNRWWKKLAYDPSLYKELRLDKDDYCVKSALKMLPKRCTRIRKLNIWLDEEEDIDLDEFMTSTGSFLTHLKASISHGITLPDCSHLIELDLDDSYYMKSFEKLSACRHLVKLVVSRTVINHGELIPVLKNNPGLQVLDMSACNDIDYIEDVMETLANHNTAIIELDVHEIYCVSSISLNHIARLENLQELDLSCTEHRLEDGLRNVMKSCKKLTKLNLSEFDYMTAEDLTCLAEHCTKLTHLDISHNMYVRSTPVRSDVCLLLLRNMPLLKELVISDCSLTRKSITEMKTLYPNVRIQVYETPVPNYRQHLFNIEY